jgi:ATP/maltotriose-dependent transcriptional regulator MalT
VALAGREPPEPAWRVDPSWSGVLLVRGLGELSGPEADQLLESRGVRAGVRKSVLAFAGGHPLTLSLAAETARRCDAAAGSGRSGVLRTLLTELIETVPSPEHRMALHVCAHADTTSEQLLRAVVRDSDPDGLLCWLRSQPFIMSSTAGLYPNDTVRELLDDDLRSRDPAAYAEMHYAVAEFELGSHAERAAARSAVEAIDHPVRRGGLPVAASQHRGGSGLSV